MRIIFLKCVFHFHVKFASNPDLDVLVLVKIICTVHLINDEFKSVKSKWRETNTETEERIAVKLQWTRREFNE